MSNISDKEKPFIEYDQSQGILFPNHLSDWIPANHLVRVVNHMIDQIDISPIISLYKPGGRPAYHPRMMLKVLIYSYCEKIYSSRKIEKALHENINFMWLSGFQKPDFRSINHFRRKIGVRLKKIFFKVIGYLLKKKHIRFENYFLDGTKIEANANKYTFVWRKATSKFKERLLKKIYDLFSEIENINREEGLKNNLKSGMKETLSTREKLSEVKKVIDESLEKNPDKELKKISKKIGDNYLPRLEKYEEYEEICGSRNSFSKTDPDATFMRMKEDHMRNGQLKAAYNVQIGTENQFILNYDIHQKPTDTTTLIPHLEGLKECEIKPENVIADAGYGSQENYEYLEKEKIEAYVKYNTFRIEDTKKFKKDPFRKENFAFDQEKNEYECPKGRRLKYSHTKKKKSENGYETTLDIYECESCEGCELKNACTKSEGNRCIQVNSRLDELKSQARLKLKSEKGIKLRKKRCIEPESVFGHIKSNRKFNRFMLRGLDKVTLEWGLLSIAHNMRKLWVIQLFVSVYILENLLVIKKGV
jgi:transposase